MLTFPNSRPAQTVFLEDRPRQGDDGIQAGAYKPGPVRVPDGSEFRQHEWKWEQDARPLVGLIVPEEATLELQSTELGRIRVGSDLLDVARGFLNERWRVIVVKRSQDATDAFAHIKALHLLGVRQVFGAAIGEFDLVGFIDSLGGSCVAGFVDLADASRWSVGLGSSSCERLKPALEIAASRAGFEILGLTFEEYITSATSHEGDAARAFGMCYAAIDALSLEYEELGERLIKAVVAAPDSISPLASCSCANRD